MVTLRGQVTLLTEIITELIPEESKSVSVIKITMVAIMSTFLIQKKGQTCNCISN